MNKLGERQVLSQISQGILQGCIVCQDEGGTQVLLKALDNPQQRDGGQVRKLMERARRRSSWLQHPGWCGLREFWLEGEQLYLVGQAPSAMTVASHLREASPELSLLTAWLVQLVDMLMEVHNQRQPFYLGKLSNEHLRVTSSGALQLIGLDVNSNFKLHFQAGADFVGPDASVDARTDVWCLGQIFGEWLDWSGESVRQAFLENRALRELVNGMRSAHPERRPSSLNIVKVRLEQMKYRAPQERRGLLAKMPAAWELVQHEYRQVLMGGVATFVTALLVMGWLFPA
ncbi:MAG: hypothetical protein J0I12_23345 [Candidatus Eremiobacteraeota bacterium]|mgnify:CR=1 FL=1|nr:hypothetical protein [Candidatus Eremiobacteraeota bacterium]